MSETSMIAEELIPPVIRDAAKRGMSFPDLLSVITRSVADAYPLPEARFAAAGIGGRRALMAKEGGCLPAKEAAAAYLGSPPSKKPQAETARRAAREHREETEASQEEGEGQRQTAERRRNRGGVDPAERRERDRSPRLDERARPGPACSKSAKDA